jgi:hypothetical protein
MRNGRAQPRIAAWASQLQSPAVESTRSRRMAHVGGIAAISALLAYLTWPSPIHFRSADGTSPSPGCW